MKKILYFSLLIAIGFGMSSCNDDITNPYAKEASTIKILSQDVLLGAGASKGVVKVSAPNGITRVTLSKDWCKASYSGDEVVVEASANKSLESRYAKLTIWSGEDSTSLQVFQSGMIFEIKGIGDVTQNSYEAKRYTYPINTNTEVVFGTSDNWVNVEVKEDAFVVNVGKNETGKPRVAEVYYGVEDNMDTIQVVQFDYEKDVKGNYHFVYYNSSEDKWLYLLATIDKNMINFTSSKWTIPISTDPATGDMSITSGSRMGTFDYNGRVLYLYLLFGDDTGGYWTAHSKEAVVKGKLMIDVDDDGSVIFYYDFTGQKYSSFGTSFSFGSFIFEAFTKDELSEANLKDKSVHIGTLNTANKPYFEKVNIDNSAKPFIGSRLSKRR